MKKLKSFWEDKRVLITGHTGFKGSWLLALLNKLGSQTFGYALKPEESPALFDDLFLNVFAKSSSRNFINDINDFDALKKAVSSAKPDIVFHLAAQPLVRKSYINTLETWKTNVIGTLNLLESLKNLDNKCSVVIVTTDKVYKNNEWEYGYRENDELGGKDPYSASKSATELLVASWRHSFCKDNLSKHPNIRLATARSGNVLGGGDWSTDRIVPDAIRALRRNEIINIRNPNYTRPWQHVLDPLIGYLKLAENQFEESNNNLFSSEFNFGPIPGENHTVEQLVREILIYWPGSYSILNSSNEFYESGLLNLQIDKSLKKLGWKPKWDFSNTVKKTIEWYLNYEKGISAYESTMSDINHFLKDYK